jgi:hypothetical protein
MQILAGIKSTDTNTKEKYLIKITLKWTLNF